MTSPCGHDKVALGSQTSYMESQGSKCKCSSEQNATPALELVQDNFHSKVLQVSGYRFKRWDADPTSHWDEC